MGWGWFKAIVRPVPMFFSLYPQKDYRQDTPNLCKVHSTTPDYHEAAHVLNT